MQPQPRSRADLFQPRVDFRDILHLQPGYSLGSTTNLVRSVSNIADVVGINLRGKKIVTIPQSLPHLTKLEWLRLSDNKISEMSPGLSVLTLLRSLFLDQNSITGLPDSYSSLTQLTHLNLSSNRLSKIPECISHMTNMIELSMAFNPNIREVDAWILKLTKLESLIGLGKSDITSLPTSITSLPCFIKEPALSRIARTGEKLNLENCDFVTGEYCDIMTKGFEEWTEIGQGGFARMFKVDLRAGPVAVKAIKLPTKPNTTLYEGVTKEAKIMANLSHANIAKIYAYGCINKLVIYVMELADGKSVWDEIVASGALSANKVALYASHINEGLSYLHSQTPPVEHRDMKPENVLVFKGVAKISDFGMACVHEAVSHTVEFNGSYHYCCPESFDSKTCGPPSDMYSFGLTIWAMLSGLRPYEGKCLRELAPLKLANKLPIVQPAYDEALVQVMYDCCKLAKTERVSSIELRPRLQAILGRFAAVSGA